MATNSEGPRYTVVKGDTLLRDGQEIGVFWGAGVAPRVARALNARDAYEELVEDVLSLVRRARDSADESRVIEAVSRLCDAVEALAQKGVL